MQDQRIEVAKIIKALSLSQYFSLDQLEQIQNKELSKVIAHHYATTPWFKQRLDQQDLDPTDVSSVKSLHKLKPFTKKDIQIAGKKFLSGNIPNDHKPLSTAKTSGRTGEPIEVVKTRINQLLYWAITIRDHDWWNRNPDHKLTSIRANNLKYGEDISWGGAAGMFTKTGAAQAIPLNLAVHEQLKLINEFRPQNLLVHAGVLGAFCTEWERNGYDLELKHIRNIGETASPELKQRVKTITGCHVEDLYSSSEVGCISIECPDSGQHHIMSESIIVEILDEADQPCRPGEIGRIVVTDLYNTASPLIRYDIGDLAEVGTSCTCGRHLPTLKQILGRRRGLFIRRDGSRFWPTAGQYAAAEIVKIRQWQIIQHTLDNIEYKLVTDEPLTQEQHQKLLDIFRAKLGFENIKIVEYRTQLPTDGKYEESVCLLDL